VTQPPGPPPYPSQDPAARRGGPADGAAAGTSRRPVVVWTLIALNVAVYALTVAQAGSISDNYLAGLFGAWELAPLDLSDHGEWWRVITSGFLHVGPLHIASNMFALWVLGRELEPVLGRARFGALYMISLLGGSAAVVLFSPPDQAVAGASGAVFGLMGGLLVVLLRRRRPVGQVVVLIAVNIAISQVIPNISLTAHLGGLVVGALAVAALVLLPARPAAQVGALSGIAVALLGVMAAGTVTA
jgi:membrane associated rhomboid family serine protease